ncbi:MAG: SpoIIE family protein phosphatase [Cytophagales bacterium]|nr:SpoIIE family protein phosphatase [Cytophagales bacterium]
MITNAAKENYFQLFPEELLASILDAFVINQPMIGEVGGDGFWVHQTPEHLFVIVFDCMGHGYGASMMTRIYTHALEHTINELGLTDPSEILSAIHEQIKAQFQEKPKRSIGSGADMGVLRISKTSRSLVFAGAKTDLICVTKGSCEVLKADRLQLGELFDYTRNYTNHSLNLGETDSVNIYMSSDGFADMIGGPDSKRFGSKNVKQLLEKIASLPMTSQKEEITGTLKSWLGDDEPVDDMLVVGLRI